MPAVRSPVTNCVTRATIVGNICNASPAGDTLGASLAFEGVLHIHGSDGMRQESLANFFLGPGKTRLKAGDVAIALHLPPPPAGSKGTYLKLGRNKLSDLSIVGVTALGYPESCRAVGLSLPTGPGLGCSCAFRGERSRSIPGQYTHHVRFHPGSGVPGS